LCLGSRLVPRTITIGLDLVARPLFSIRLQTVRIHFPRSTRVVKPFRVRRVLTTDRSPLQPHPPASETPPSRGTGSFTELLRATAFRIGLGPEYEPFDYLAIRKAPHPADGTACDRAGSVP
jgi:hypothetical protein